jgi:hypothetical protein
MVATMYASGLENVISIHTLRQPCKAFWNRPGARTATRQKRQNKANANLGDFYRLYGWDSGSHRPARIDKTKPMVNWIEFIDCMIAIPSIHWPRQTAKTKPMVNWENCADCSAASSSSGCCWRTRKRSQSPRVPTFDANHLSCLSIRTGRRRQSITPAKQ